MSVTTIVITDPELLAKLAAADGPIVFRGPSGDAVQTAVTVPFGKLPPGMKSPISDEEFEEARKAPSSSWMSRATRRRSLPSARRVR